MSRRVLRFEIPVGADYLDVGPDVSKPLITGPVLWVKSRDHGQVDFWAEGDIDANAGPIRRFTVIGTGQFVPRQARYCGSTEDARDMRLIWHLWEICRHGDNPSVTESALCPVCGYDR